MQRIKRNASYYTDRTKQNHWCDACFSEKKANDPIHLDDGTEIYKKDLQEFKNDALPEEGWVNCDDCQSWVHQICSLFNGRTNKSTARFTCPACYVNKPIPEGARAASKAVQEAQDLPRCKMSDAIEDGMKEALQTAYRKRASELGVTVDEVEKAEGLAVRVVSNVDKRHMVGDKVRLFLCSPHCESSSCKTFKANNNLFFLSRCRCLNATPQKIAPANSPSGRSALLSSKEYTGWILFSFPCMFTSTDTIALLQTKGAYTFPTWTRCSILSPNAIALLRIIRLLSSIFAS